MLTGTQAVFTPANTANLKAVVTVCLAETADGSCPVLAASIEPVTGNSYGVIGSWDTSLVEDMKESKL